MALLEPVVRKVLFVDDDATLREAAARALSRHGCEVATAANPAEAVPLARALVPDLAIIDLYYGSQRQGLDLASELRAAFPGLAVVICSGLLSVRVDELLARGLDDATMVTKPVSFRALLAAANAAPGVAVEDWPTLAEIKRAHVVRIVTACEGNVSKTARVLGCDRAAVQRLLKRLGIDVAAMRPR